MTSTDFSSLFPSGWVSHSNRLEEHMADVSNVVSQLPAIKPDILLRVKTEGGEQRSQTAPPQMANKDSGMYSPSNSSFHSVSPSEGFQCVLISTLRVLQNVAACP